MHWTDNDPEIRRRSGITGRRTQFPGAVCSEQLWSIIKETLCPLLNNIFPGSNLKTYAGRLFLKEINAFFSSPVGYLVIAVFFDLVRAHPVRFSGIQPWSTIMPPWSPFPRERTPGFPAAFAGDYHAPLAEETSKERSNAAPNP
ncbi:MAG: hypothetical protein IPI11_18455 [Haliscomenobacter sp.]|nr:hypothetical protein [Haliscomenobacter sp.]